MRYGSSTVTEVWADPKTLRELKEFVRMAEHAWFSDEAALQWNEECLFFRRTDFQKSWTQLQLDFEVGEESLLTTLALLPSKARVQRLLSALLPPHIVTFRELSRASSASSTKK